MFSGIVSFQLPVGEIRRGKGILQFCLPLPEEWQAKVQVGDSVAVDGVCLTVTSLEGNRLHFDVVGETLQRTTLSHLEQGRQVNVELALRLGDPIGGHLVTGHVFGTAKIHHILPEGESRRVTFSLPPEWTKYLLEKGFVAVDGVSLTVTEVERAQGRFSVALIPETLRRTTLGWKTVGDEVNLEWDQQIQAVVDTVERLARENLWPLSPSS